MEQNTDTGTPMMPVVDNKQKNSNGLKIATVIACVVAVCGIGFGVYGMIQSSTSNTEIENLKNKITEQEESTKEEQSISKQDELSEITTTDDITEAMPTSTGNYSLFVNKFGNAENQRYELVYVSGGTRTASNNISSEDDKYYILDTQKLGSADDLRQFDLVSVMRPLTDQKIKNGMPEVANYNVYSDNDKMYLSQCESFSVEYMNGHDYLALSLGFDLGTDIPIAVNYSCHFNNGTTQRLYHRAIYSLNAESGTVKELEQFATSDFTNN